MSPVSVVAAHVAMGIGCVIAGGLLAAVTATTGPTQLTSWTVAYLVLVAGVAQVGLGVAGWQLGSREPSMPALVVGLVGWNLGNALVIIGTLASAVWPVVLGGLVLGVTLAAHLWTVRGAAADGPRRWAQSAYRLLVLVLLVSIPVGVVLAAVRSP